MSTYGLLGRNLDRTLDLRDTEVVGQGQISVQMNRVDRNLLPFNHLDQRFPSKPPSGVFQTRKAVHSGFASTPPPPPPPAAK